MRAALNAFTTWFSNWKLWQWWQPGNLSAMVPPEQWRFQYAYAALTLLCLVGGIALALIKMHPPLKQRLLAFLWTNALLGIVLYFFRLQRIPIIGSDIWRFLQEAGDLLWLSFIGRYVRSGYRKEKTAEKVAAYKQRFLPGKPS